MALTKEKSPDFQTCAKSDGRRPQYLSAAVIPEDESQEMIASGKQLVHPGRNLSSEMRVVKEECQDSEMAPNCCVVVIVEDWTTRRQAVRNYLISLVSIAVFYSLIHSFYRHGLQKHLMCLDFSHSPPEIDCKTTSEQLDQFFYGCFFQPFVAIHFCVLAALVSGPQAISYKKTRKFWPLMFLWGVFIAWLGAGAFYDVPILLILFLGILTGPVLERKTYNHSGLKLVIFLITQWTITRQLFNLLGPYLSKKMFSNISYTILAPFFIQFNQGLAIYICQRLSDTILYTPTSMDAIIMMTKYEMAYLSALKLTVLIKAYNQSDFIITSAINLILDAMGRNQVWRIWYGGFMTAVMGTPVDIRLKYLAKLVVSSEIDMDYLPFMLLVVMRLLDSTVLNLAFARFHVKNGFLDLSGSSGIKFSWRGLGVMFLLLVLGDVASFVMARALGRKRRLYEFKLIFAKSLLLGCAYGITLSNSILSLLQGASHVLNED